MDAHSGSSYLRRQPLRAGAAQSVKLVLLGPAVTTIVALFLV
jgi:hypothetical protein